MSWNAGGQARPDSWTSRYWLGCETGSDLWYIHWDTTTLGGLFGSQSDDSCTKQNLLTHSVQGTWLCWQGRIILSLTLTSFLILLHNPTAPCEIVWHFLLWHRATPVLDIQVRSVGQWYCRPNWAKKGRERRRVCIGRAERSSHRKASPYFTLLFASFMVKNMLPGASPWFKPQLCLFPASHLTSLCLIYLFIFSFLKWGWQTHLSHGVVRTKWGDELKTTQFSTWPIVNPIDVRYYWY